MYLGKVTLVKDLKQFIQDNKLKGLEGDLEMLARYQGWLMQFRVETVPAIHYYCFCILIEDIFIDTIRLRTKSQQLNFGINLFLQEQGL